MNVREATNAGLAKFGHGFKEIQENQRKIVEAYLGGREYCWLHQQAGCIKSLTFHIAPVVLDFYKHGERDLVDTSSGTENRL